MAAARTPSASPSGIRGAVTKAAASVAAINTGRASMNRCRKNTAAANAADTAITARRAAKRSASAGSAVEPTTRNTKASPI
jgi:hypothetical protein